MARLLCTAHAASRTSSFSWQACGALAAASPKKIDLRILLKHYLLFQLTKKGITIDFGNHKPKHSKGTGLVSIAARVRFAGGKKNLHPPHVSIRLPEKL
jgi:hypothetical protein